MEENYVEGDLGLVFNNAAPQTLPEVARLLRQRCADSYDPSDRARPLVQSTLGQVEVLQETSCTAEAVAELSAMHLRLRAAGAGEGSGAFGSNAHLAGLQVDEDGNLIVPAAGDEDVLKLPSSSRRVPLRRFEVVALATLTPHSVSEALVLIPSLARYDEEDLQEAIALVEQ